MKETLKIVRDHLQRHNDIMYAQFLTDVINEMPDIVFCKECKHCRKKMFGVWNVLYCHVSRLSVDEDDYCSKGAR